MASEPVASSIPQVHKRVISIQRQEHHSSCQFADGTKFLLPRILSPYVTIGDEIAFPIPSADAAGAEIYITKNCSSGENRFLYQAPIGYVSHPKRDKRNQYRSEEHTSELQSLRHLVCRLLLEKKKI